VCQHVGPKDGQYNLNVPELACVAGNRGKATTTHWRNSAAEGVSEKKEVKIQQSITNIHYVSALPFL
jgi:hypothetical protein